MNPTAEDMLILQTENRRLKIEIQQLQDEVPDFYYLLYQFESAASALVEALKDLKEMEYVDKD